ncbi:hypothetical protein RchiOBHm_Chr5g0059821 [Rosa chinensis]|uniref:Uncharacterized protein n=1 Tax=Rosa chinensis TaxID=74649 RepID=A0A2P6QHJ2_ROSCH|nr:hypothetical protein RchiOBHm_Chr5g0059821 [Rosa chinensis]
MRLHRAQRQRSLIWDGNSGVVVGRRSGTAVLDDCNVDLWRWSLGLRPVDLLDGLGYDFGPWAMDRCCASCKSLV